MALVAAVGLFVSRPARGEGPGAAPVSIGVVARGCGADLREVRELPDRLGMELAPVQVEARSTPPLLEVSTSCTAVESVSFLDGNGTHTRPLSLEDVAPELRPVALAVLAAEFLRSIWATPQSSGAVNTSAPAAPAEAAPASASTAVVAKPPPAPPPAVAPPDHPTKDHAGQRRPEQSKGVRFGAGALLRYFPSSGSVLGGPELSLTGSPLFVAANATFGSAEDPLGTISLGVVAGTLGARLPFAKSSAVALSGAAAVDFGWSWATAMPGYDSSLPRSTGTAFAALTLGPELDIPIAGAFGLTLSLRAGAARGVVATADGRQIAGAQGFTLSSSAVVHYAL
jgi:hypothetical protein